MDRHLTDEYCNYEEDTYRCLTCGETIPDGHAHFRDYSQATGWSNCKVVLTPFTERRNA